MYSIIGAGCPPLGDYATSGRDCRKLPVDLHTSRFFQRHLLQKAMSVFKFENIPTHWAKDYFLYTLYCWGFLAVVNTDAFGVIPQGCGLQGYDVMYRPTHAVITNPLLRGIKTPRIGVECALVKLRPDYGGIMDVVTFYADMMALTATTAGVNLANSKLSYVFGASNKAGAESFKKMHKDILNGEPAVAVDKSLFNSDGSLAVNMLTQNVGQNYITDRLLSDLRKIENMFDTCVGIPNANTDKRERLIVDEVNANNIETDNNCELWLEEIRSGFECANNMFGLNLRVDWREKPVKNGGVANENVCGTV